MFEEVLGLLDVLFGGRERGGRVFFEALLAPRSTCRRSSASWSATGAFDGSLSLSCLSTNGWVHSCDSFRLSFALSVQSRG